MCYKAGGPDLLFMEKKKKKYYLVPKTGVSIIKI